MEKQFYQGKMRKFNIILFFLLIACTVQTYSQVLLLDSILKRIEENNPMLKMYDEQINATNAFNGPLASTI